MGFPSPSPEEIEAENKRKAECDVKIAAAKTELERRKAENLLSRDTQSVEEAQIEYAWAIYDKTSLRRPLYPRKRAISPGSRSYRKQKQEYSCHHQIQSNFFKLLPSEIRAEIYRMVFGNLIIEISAQHAGFLGPPPSSEYRVYRGSRIVDADGGGEWASGLLFRESPTTYTPYVIPLLQSCRRIYAESINILYSENVFKNRGYHNDVYWTKFLLHQRLQTIRSAHFQLNLGYSWTAPIIRIALEAYAELKALQKLCIDGRAAGTGMIDGKEVDVIDAKLWKKGKHLLIPLFRKYSFIKDVDIFLPIMQKTLTQRDTKAVRGPRLHGFTEEQIRGEKPSICACLRQPEKIQLRVQWGIM